MKILVIGKNGFAGKNLCEFYEGRSDIELTATGHKDLDLLNEEEVRTYFADRYFDVVIDAAVYNPRVGVDKKPEKELEYDLRMFHNIVKNRDRFGKLIYFGSGAEYDKRFPICSVKEDELPRSIPVTDYGFAKYIIGREIDSGMYENVYNLRIFGLFGKYENWVTTFISGACCKAVKDLPITIRRDVYFDYLYVEDFCKIIDSFIKIDRPEFHTYNLCSGRRILLSELADIVKKVSGKDLPTIICNDGLANEYTASNERLLKEIGGYSFESCQESIEKLYKWYEDHSDIINSEQLIYGL